MTCFLCAVTTHLPGYDAEDAMLEGFILGLGYARALPGIPVEHHSVQICLEHRRRIHSVLDIAAKHWPSELTADLRKKFQLPPDLRRV